MLWPGGLQASGAGGVQVWWVGLANTKPLAWPAMTAHQPMQPGTRSLHTSTQIPSVHCAVAGGAHPLRDVDAALAHAREALEPLVQQAADVLSQLLDLQGRAEQGRAEQCRAGGFGAGHYRELQSDRQEGRHGWRAKA